MNDFNAKWQACAARAREASRPDEEAPFGFAARVQRAVLASTTSSPGLEFAWQRLTWRSLGFVGAILLICAIVEVPHLNDRKPLEPGIENAVAQVVWNL
jgi:hypothetical protein